MSREVDIPRNEPRTVRVFAINRPPEDVLAALKAAPKSDVARDVLNDPHLNTSSAEIFATSDLSGMGLATYLIQAHDVIEDVTQADAGKLDALDGYVLLVFSDSFSGKAYTLTLGTDVTFIGAYTEHVANAPSERLTTDSALPYTGAPGIIPQSPVRNGIGSIITVILAALVLGFVAWWMTR